MGAAQQMHVCVICVRREHDGIGGTSAKKGGKTTPVALTKKPKETWGARSSDVGTGGRHAADGTGDTHH